MDVRAVGRAPCMDGARRMKRRTRWCDAAAGAGHVDCLDYMHNRLGLPWNKNTCRGAAHNGHLDCLTFAHRGGCAWNSDTTRVSAANGHLDCLQYALDNHCHLTHGAVCAAARNGHIKVLSFVFEHTRYTPDKAMCRQAIGGGNLSMLAYLCERGVVPTEDCAETALKAGRIDIVHYLHGRGIKPDPFYSANGMAMMSGNVRLLRYLYDSGYCYGGANHAERAAYVGRPDMVVCAIGQGAWCTAWIIRRAAKRGWTSVLIAAHESDPQTPGYIVERVIIENKISCLGALLDRGINISSSHVTRATALGRTHILELLKQRGIV